MTEKLEHPLTLEFVETIKNALKSFGEYTFMDKGPDEVIDMGTVIGKLKELDIKTVAEILSGCLDSTEVDEGFTYYFVEVIISGLDEMPDFEKLFEFDDRFEY